MGLWTSKWKVVFHLKSRWTRRAGMLCERADLLLKCKSKRKRSKSRLETVQLVERRRKKLPPPGVQIDGGKHGKVGGFCTVTSTHPDRAQIWLFCTWQGSDSPLLVLPALDTHTHTLSKKWRTHTLPWEEYTKCFHTPFLLPFKNKLCSALLVLFISKLGSCACVSEETNWPGQENSQSFLHKSIPPPPDGRLTGLEKAKSKPSITPLGFTHMRTSSSLCMCAHKITDLKLLKGSKKHRQCAATSHTKGSQKHKNTAAKARVLLIGTDIWLDSTHRWC